MRGTRDASPDREQPSPAAAALRALQRQAGNGAVASMVGSSRTLCRCPGRCTCGGAQEAELSDEDRRPRVLARQAAATGADLRCSYEARQIAEWGGPAGKMPLDRVCKDIVTAFTGCDIGPRHDRRGSQGVRG